MTTGADVVTAARAEIGTPWVHQGRLPGRALDCAGLIITVARALALVPSDFDVNGYSRAPDGSMTDILGQWCEQIEAPELGAIVCVRSGRLPQHVGIVGDYVHGGYSMIHSSNSSKPPRVVEHRLVFLSTMRLVSVWRLPGVA